MFSFFTYTCKQQQKSNQTMWAPLWAMRKPVNHKSAGEDTQGFDIMGLMHHREIQKKKCDLPHPNTHQLSRVAFSDSVFLLMWWLYGSSAALCVFKVWRSRFAESCWCTIWPAGSVRRVTSEQSRAERSWMLLLASGCTASDVTSSSHPSIHIWAVALTQELEPITSWDFGEQCGRTQCFYCVRWWGESCF